jgi:hypothetical protein
VERSEDSFNKKKNGLQPWCRECNRIRSRQYYADNKEKHLKLIKENSARRKERLRQMIYEIKSKSGCIICGENDPVCLDFHHPNDDKELNIGTAMAERRSWEKIKKEIDKCVVICSNHHRKLHAGKIVL